MLVPVQYALARFAGRFRPKRRPGAPSVRPAVSPAGRPLADGLSVVIPSRNGRELLAAQLPEIARQLAAFAHEIVIVDNGSDDGTAEWLAAAWPRLRVEVSADPLSFARAVNRGIARSRYTHVCLLNNDMLLAPNFFGPLGVAFESVPGLFCATAQIRFPEGARREETGKAVLTLDDPTAFPVRCDTPWPGEDGTWVLYGSGGCSVYDAAKLRELGGLDEAYDPAYVEDLDIGYRAWQRGWPTVYVAGSLVEHRHRATTSRYYTPEQLDEILEINYLKFLARAVASRKLFRRLWLHAIRRLRARAPREAAARNALSWAASIALSSGPEPRATESEDAFLALTGGEVSVFPGLGPHAAKRPTLLVARPSAGEAPRPGDAGQVLLAFADEFDTPPSDLLALYAAVVLVRPRAGAPSDPDPVLRAALRQSVRRWRIANVRLETAAMQFYARDCAPAACRLA